MEKKFLSRESKTRYTFLKTLFFMFYISINYEELRIHEHLNTETQK